jgi:curved DNA-binding protein CbpA
VAQAAQSSQSSQSAVAIGPGHSAPSTTSTAVGDDIDLDLEQRAKVEELFSQIEVLDYYAILGVPRGADKKAVKRAYYELAANFHPDKFFRKSLGAYKAKMEAIFGRLTVAHDTLTSKTERAEYDAYLGVRATVSEQESMLAGAHDEIRKAEEDIQRAARHTVPISVAPPPITEAPRAPSIPPVTAFTPSKSFDVQAAREALARKLRGGQAMPPRPPQGAPSTTNSPSQMPPPPANPLSARDAVDALKRRYEERMVDSRAAQVAKYKTAGEAAIAKGDYVAGVNALRVALSFDPDNTQLAAQTDEAQRSADSLLAENYEKQALYEEKNDQWSHASRSWARVARARPSSAMAQERAANAILRSQGNVREAAEFAKRAVGLENKNGGYHATLAWAYLVGGMLLNAKREIEIAAQLAAEDPTVVAIAKRIKDAS